MKMNKSVLASAVALSLSANSPLLMAESSVVGQVSTNNGAVVSSGEAEHRFGSEAIPYISGDVISTKGRSEATLVLSDGDLAVTLLPDSSASISDGVPTQIELFEGALTFDFPADIPVQVISGEQSATVVSSVAAEAMVLLRDGELVVSSLSGDLAVEYSEGLSTSVSAGNSLVIADNGAEITESAAVIAAYAALGTAAQLAVLAALVATGFIVEDQIINNDDGSVTVTDDTGTVTVPAGSPAGG